MNLKFPQVNPSVRTKEAVVRLTLCQCNIVHLYGPRSATSHKGSICHSRLAVYPTHTNVIGRVTEVNHGELQILISLNTYLSRSEKINNMTICIPYRTKLTEGFESIDLIDTVFKWFMRLIISIEK